MIIKKGITRTVIVIGNYAIKLAFNLRFNHLHFLNACLSNYCEKIKTIQFRNFPDYYEYIVPTIFCSWFGLFSIQYKVDILTRSLSDNEKMVFKLITDDLKSENFGYFNGKLVCVDYGY